MYRPSGALDWDLNRYERTHKKPELKDSKSLVSGYVWGLYIRKGTNTPGNNACERFAARPLVYYECKSGPMGRETPVHVGSQRVVSRPISTQLLVLMGLETTRTCEQ